MTLPNSIEIALIGAGPHALTLAAHLLQKCQQGRERFLAFDPSGIWMSRWHQQFAALQILHLRSPAVHHPDPNSFALRRFAECRPQELYPPYDLPGTQLFKEFCQDIVDRWQLENHVFPGQVVRIEPVLDRYRLRFRVWLAEGQSILARRVVVANRGGKPHFADWVQQISTPYPGDRLRHSSQIDLRAIRLEGEQVLIVGGGLTTGHLAIGAIARGANVALMHRRQFYEKLFDAEPGWLGPKYLKAFWAELDLERRWQMIQQARNGGSMTPAIMTQLRRAQRDGTIEFHQHCQIVKATWQGQRWQVECDDGTTHQCDRIWLATGTQLDATTEPLLAEMQAKYPLPIVRGLPMLDEHLRWASCELFVMGGLAALQIGPTARNLFGARMASERIVPALIKPSLAL